MLHFNELRYSQDNKYLIIDVAVDNSDYYQDITLDSIIIDNQSTFTNNGPSLSPIYNQKVIHNSLYKSEPSIYKYIIDDPESSGQEDSYKKKIRVLIELNSIGVDINRDMLFVYVTTEGSVSEEIQDLQIKNYILGTVVNLFGIYTSMLCFIRQVESECSVPRDFINLILRFKALELCVKTGNYPLAIKYWNKYFSKTTNTNCYG